MLLMPEPAHAAAPPNDDFASAAIISTLPFDDALQTSEGTTASDDPYCVGQGPTLWYAFTAEAAATIEANTFGSFYDTTLSVYSGSRGSLSVLACNDDSAGLQSRVRFSAVAGETYYFMVGSFGSGPGGYLRLSVHELVPPANDDFHDATAVGALPYTDSLLTAGATTSVDDPYCSGREATVWYAFTPTSDTRIQVEVFGSGYFAQVSVWTGARGALSSVACGHSQRVRFDALEDQTYYIMVASFGGGGSLMFNLSVAPPPLAIDVLVDGSGRVVPTTGMATLSGSVTCNSPAYVFGSGHVQQKIGQGLVSGYFYLSVFCDAVSPAPWSATLSSQPVTEIGSGRAATLFTGGRMTVSGYAYAYEPIAGESAQDIIDTTVTLRGSH